MPKRQPTCRYCHRPAPREVLVRIGSGQYAHANCGLEAGGERFIAALEARELARISIGTARAYGVLEHVTGRLEELGA